ncbi:MAG: hypothetical protein ACTSR7_05135 [Promethearchaeota archaeon]
MKENNVRIFYLIGLSVSAVLMLVLMIFGGFTLNLTSIIFFYAFKFLSGFGLILSIANGFLILLDKASEKLDKKATNIVIIIQICIPFVFIGYGIYSVISGYLRNALFSPSGFWLVIDILIYVYGILSLLLTLYILPLMKDKFYKGMELSKFTGLKKGAKGAARKVKKKYFTLKGNYAKGIKQDQLTVKDLLDSWKTKFAINFLLIIGIGSLIFTPLAFLCIFYWFRLYIFFRSERKDFERFALMIAIGIIGIIALVAPFLNLPFYTTIAQFIWTINLFYLFGITLASYVLIKRLLSVQGYTRQELKMRKKDKHIENLEKEKEELEKQLQSKNN